MRMRAVAVLAAVVVGAGVVRAIRMRHGSAVRGDEERRVSAERLYDARDFHGAYDIFRSLARQMPGGQSDGLPVAEYNTGDAAYRLGHFQDAVQHFRAALAGPPAMQARAHYNLGNCYIWLARAESDKRGALQAAVNAYEEAVLLDPGDVDAKWNLELAVQHLADERARLGGGTHRQANWGGGNLTKSGYQGAPQTGAGATPGGGYGAAGGEDVAQQLTETQARRILEETERAQLSGQEVRPMAPSRVPSRQKDW